MLLLKRKLKCGRTGGHNTPMFNVTVEGYQSVKSVGNFGSAHYKRKPGVYKNLTQSATSGAGSNANFDIIVDEFGVNFCYGNKEKSRWSNGWSWIRTKRNTYNC